MVVKAKEGLDKNLALRSVSPSPNTTLELGYLISNRCPIISNVLLKRNAMHVSPSSPSIRAPHYTKRLARTLIPTTKHPTLTVQL